jgi:rSAM/selenodomain-associated transferase 1
MPTPKKCILLFLRAPEKGRVKTRLAAGIGDNAALDLYRLFVEDILGMLSRTGYPVVLYGHPAEKLGDISTWLGPNLPCRPQAGGDLGLKMAMAFSEVFSSGFEKVLLIGSDIPDLPSRIIQSAFSALDQEGAAIGPAEDGGYYLIAFNRSAFSASVFDNISWGSEKVLPQTLAAFRENDTLVHRLEIWRDIDTIEDLEALSARYPTDDSAAPRTLAYIRGAGFEDSRGRVTKGNSQNKT